MTMCYYFTSLNKPPLKLPIKSVSEDKLIVEFEEKEYFCLKPSFMKSEYVDYYETYPVEYAPGLYKCPFNMVY